MPRRHDGVEHLQDRRLAILGQALDGTQLVRLVYVSGFTLDGERIESGARRELQIERDQWLPRRIHWSAHTGTPSFSS
jgi:hypothetical protein